PGGDGGLEECAAEQTNLVAVERSRGDAVAEPEPDQPHRGRLPNRRRFPSSTGSGPDVREPVRVAARLAVGRAEEGALDLLRDRPAAALAHLAIVHLPDGADLCRGPGE